MLSCGGLHRLHSVRNKWKLFAGVSFVLCWHTFSFGQACCGGGGGSPIAGGLSHGVLQERQFEFGSSYQFLSTDIFYRADHKDTLKYFDSFHSQYIYSRAAYGITKKLTFSAEAGYWIDKTQIALDNSDTVSSSGIGDMILFPRYNVYSRNKNMKTHTELTVGMGMKIPLGRYNDSVGRIEPFSGHVYYLTKPQAVQTSSGANDFIFYTFFMHDFLEKDFRLFANAFYIRKGWNPVGEKMGDYCSVGIFAGKTIKCRIGLTLQVRAEWTASMKINETVLLFAYPNYDPEATGSKKIFVAPQLSYSWKSFTVFGLGDIPVYQYVNKSQAGSKFQLSAGINYRFLLSNEGITFCCPMHPEETSKEAGLCSKCGMSLEKSKTKKDKSAGGAH